MSTLFQKLAEYFRYGVVVSIGLVLDIGLLYTLTTYAGVPYLISAGIGFCTGLISNYLLSVRYVFRNRITPATKNDFRNFALIGVSALTLNQILMYVGVDIFNMPILLSKAFVLPVTFTWNFLWNKFMVFR